MVSSYQEGTALLGAKENEKHEGVADAADVTAPFSFNRHRAVAALVLSLCLFAATFAVNIYVETKGLDKADVASANLLDYSEMESSEYFIEEKLMQDDELKALYEAQKADFESGMSKDDIMAKYGGDGPSVQRVRFPCCKTVNRKCNRIRMRSPMNPNTFYYVCRSPLGSSEQCGPMNTGQTQCCGQIGHKFWFWQKCK